MLNTYPCKKRSPGSTSKGYAWNSVDDIVYVNEADLMDLLTSSHGEIYEVKEEELSSVSEITEDAVVREVAEVRTAPEVTTGNDLSEATSAASVTKPLPNNPL